MASKLSPRTTVTTAFGDPKLKASGTATWLVLETWFIENIVRVSFPKFNVEADVHYKIVRQLYLALKEVADSVSTDAARAKLVEKINHSFCPRAVKDNPGSVSYHTYGIALDINAHLPKNGFRLRKSTEASGYYFDQDSSLVKALESHGFHWGGRWGLPGQGGRGENEYGKVDAMHFEAGSWFGTATLDSSKNDLSDIAKDTEYIMINYNPPKFRTYLEGDEVITQETGAASFPESSQPKTITYDSTIGEVTISSVAGGVTAVEAERVYLY